MCGIAGFVLREEVPDPAIVKMMCDQIRHRGPDDEGFYLHGGCALGMRRLSIIDLATGHQPICNEDGTVWVVFNGEIYNYRELREELSRRGHVFSTASDTEVLVHLYEEEGERGIPRLRGMFAFAIWDARRSLLLLARDRFGKKPLYYAALPRGLYFGSEIKCLVAAGIPLNLDDAALTHYLHLGFIPHPRSIYETVRKVAPGGWLVYGQNGEVRQGRYWRATAGEEAAPSGTPTQEIITQIGKKFDESVRIRMVADVPLGAFLSGGIDSGSVVASMALHSTEPVKTFSIGFEEPGFNELEYAALVAKRYSTEHHAIVVRPDVIELVPRLIRQFDEPFGDCSAIPTFIVSEFAATHVKVALSGDGGDELFTGYDEFLKVERLRPWDRVPPTLRWLLSVFASVLPYSARGKNFMRMVSCGTSLERFFEVNYAPRFLLERLVRERWLPPAGLSYLRTEFADCLQPESVSALGQAVYFATTCALPEDMLVKVDRMSMANSLEVRCPLLDHELAELAARVPARWNMRGNRGKQVFLDAVGDRLPPALLQLRKTGFGVPLAAWFRGPLKDLLQDHLLAPQFLQKDIVSPDFVRYLIDEHLRGRRDNYYWLWRLLVLDLWLRENAKIL
jgi:asparagine synthase (glutamine-hydrolysing)